MPNPRNAEHEQAGLIIYGRQSKTLPIAADGQWYYARIVMDQTDMCRFYLSNDGRTWVLLEEEFKAVPGEWVGTRIGFYATRDWKRINDSGYLDIDWMHLTPTP